MYQESGDGDPMNTSHDASTQKSQEDKWVQNYIEKGGDEADGRALYRKMHGSKSLPETVKNSLVTVADETLKNLPQPETSEGNADLFGQAPIDINKPPKKKVAVVKRAVGRPNVDWSKREKTQRELELFQLSLEIEKQPAKEANQIGAIATAMIYASLPHSKVDGAVFKRKNGDLSLTMLNDPDIGLPYGKVPRIITAFLCTEAARHQSPIIDLGKSQAEFAKKLGLNSGGGKRGDLTRLKDQAMKLFTSHITLTGTTTTQFHWKNVNISENGMLLWNPQNHNEKSAWESRLTLSETFFDECIKHSVPIDLRVLHELRSPLAIDIYIWMTYRYNSLAGPMYISWKQLKWQFGSNYADTEQGLVNFISNFKAQLRAVQKVYPEAKFSADKGKLTLFPSRPHVLPGKPV